MADPSASGREAPSGRRPLRSDAVITHERILEAAHALGGRGAVTMSDVAATAGVSRATLYRHFPTRADLEEAIRDPVDPQLSADSIGATVIGLPYQPAGRLGHRDPLPLEVTRVLDEVPAHLIPEQLVAEARRLSGTALSLYVVDIDGSQLLRIAGTAEFPEFIDAPPALGPEIVPEGLPALYHRLNEQLPGCAVEPLWLRGRVLGLLLCVGQPTCSLGDIARQGAAALELANDYTDFIEAARRRKPTTPAAEIQQNLFPPRIARISGAQVAGVLLPSYEVGGDWFDFVENRDGGWLAIADTVGNGPTAAGLGAACLGALRAARRAGGDLEDAVHLMHETVMELGSERFQVSAIIARWRAPTSTLTWVNCGHPAPLHLEPGDSLTELDSPPLPALGAPDFPAEFTPSRRTLASGDRLILVTKGITERQMTDGSRFGVDGIRTAVADVEQPTAAYTALAIQQAVTDAWKEPLQDDGTIVVVAIT